MSDDSQLYTLEQSQLKLDEISSILRYKFGDQWKFVIFLCGLFLFLLTLLIIFGIDVSQSSFKDQLNHIKAFFIVLFLGIGFFCIWFSILPDDKKTYGIVPFPTSTNIIPVDNTQCGINPTLCDSNKGCSLCIDSDNVNNYDCITIPKDKVIYYLGTPLQPGKSYCLPKPEQIRTLLNGCGTYTGKIVWGIGQDGTQGWRCECLYPSLYGDPNQGCLKQIVCQNGGQLIDQTDGKTVWDPSNMPASLVGVSPYELMKDGSPRFRCQCGPGFYNLPEDPYICHPNLCYVGSSAENTQFDVNTRKCQCNPSDNVIQSNVSGFCYPIDNNCNPDTMTGGCKYGIDIFDKNNDGTNSPILFMKNGRYYTSDIQNGKSYLIDISDDITRLNLDKTKILNIDNTILKDAFYAFKVNPSSSFSGGQKGLDSALTSLINTDMVSRLNNIALKSTKSSSPGIARLCNSFFYKHNETPELCLNQLSKTGTESFPNFDKDISLIDCGGSSIGIAQVNILNTDKGYDCQCIPGQSQKNGLICIPCTPAGKIPPNEDASKCCSGVTKTQTGGDGKAVEVCGEMSDCSGGAKISNVGGNCGDDCNCVNGKCGLTISDNGEEKRICCPFDAGKPSEFYATWCTNLPSNYLCKHDFQCQSGSCDSNRCK